MSIRKLLFSAFVCAAFFAGLQVNAESILASSTNILAAATNKIQIPVSVFTIPTSPSEGRDPFYPESNRFGGSPTNAAPVVPTVALTLQGISGAVGNRLAIINGRTLGEGEEAELVLGATRVHIRCITIALDSVTVEVEGTKRELHMRSH